MRILLGIVLNALALVITDWLIPGLLLADTQTIILAAILLGLVNTFIRPILLLISLPLNILSLGLFTFVVNALMLSLVAWILGNSFQIENFWWALLSAAVLSVVSTVLSTLLKDLAFPKKK